MLERIAAVVLALLVAAGLGGWVMHGYMAPKVAAAELAAEHLGDQVREQNRAVQSLRDAEATRKAEADARVAAAAAVARNAELSAQRLLSLALPAGADECVAARALIAKELKE